MPKVIIWLVAAVVALGSFVGALDKVLSFASAHADWAMSLRPGVARLLNWLDGDAFAAAGHPLLAKLLMFLWGCFSGLLAAECFRYYTSFRIVSPSNGSDVYVSFKVQGQRRFVEQHVQVLVYDGDNKKWWVQGQPTPGRRWECDCYAGYKQGQIGRDFRVVAIAMPMQPGVAKFDDIPPGYMRSQIIKVTKKSGQ